MTESKAKHAWVDESMRIVESADGIFILAAVICDPEKCEPIRDTLRSLWDKKQARLHWRAERHVRRNQLAKAIAQMEFAALIDA